MSNSKDSKKNLPIKVGSALDFKIGDLIGKAKVTRIQNGVTITEEHGLKFTGKALLTLTFNNFTGHDVVAMPGIRTRIVRGEIRGLLPVNSKPLNLSGSMLHEETIEFSKRK